MAQANYSEINTDDLWTKNGRQLYEAGLYEPMIETWLERMKKKPINKAHYEKFKEQMIEYLYYTYVERDKKPLDACAKLARYGKQAMQLFPDTAKISYWNGYLETVKWLAEYAANPEMA